MKTELLSSFRIFVKFVLWYNHKSVSDEVSTVCNADDYKYFDIENIYHYGQ